MNKSTISGYLLIGAGVLKAISDFLSGQFSIANDFTPLMATLGGSSIVFVRSAIGEVKNLLTTLNIKA